jgi:predicted AAA+ superfamily ATPase
MIKRQLEHTFRAFLADPKAIILFGPRQVGKTTLLRQWVATLQEPVLWWNGDEPDTRQELKNATSSFLSTQLSGYKWLIIDEAQRIENIGLLIKLIYDNVPGIKIIATGSSSFDLANRISEPLTGRKWEFEMYPFSFAELAAHYGLREEKRLLKHRLVYGFYPDVINNPGKEAMVLKELSDSYLYKDILAWENIQKPAKLEKLIQALAFQVGSLVSINELSQTTGLDNHTIERYISILEKSFVIFQVQPFSRNLRNEIKKSRKIYFCDNGIRNAVISQFGTFDLRQDKGALWENFLMSERRKLLSYSKSHAQVYFWRNHANQEIDYVEEKDGTLAAFECKWSETAKGKIPRAFIEEYEPAITGIVNEKQFSDFVMYADLKKNA